MIYCGGHDEHEDGDDSGDESKDITEEALTMHFCNGARMISRNTQYTRRMREPSRITTTVK